jgi:hypothetical protein
MFEKKIRELRDIRKNHPFFFFFSHGVIFLYALQILLKTEITPLGYFSLYSNPAYPQIAYSQILPAYQGSEKPVNIYEAKGTGFLMLEILPTRYEILRRSDHCNQMNHKLQRIGLYDKNTRDCAELEKFHEWLPVYMQRIGLPLHGPYELRDFGFKNGALIHSKPIGDVQ